MQSLATGPRQPLIEYRNAVEEDLLQVMNINRICLPENYSYSFFESIFRDYPKTFWVACADGRVGGYVMCKIERIFSKLETLRIKKAGHVVSLAVMPDLRQRGVGSELMRRSLESMRKDYDCEESFLEVRVSNQAATNLYRKLGYVITDRQKGYYVDGEDAYVMSRKI